MERSDFARKLEDAAENARDFARQYLIEEIPEAMRFRVRLNCSYDGNPLHAGEVVFPEDTRRERELGLLDCTVAHAVDALWRDGRVPEWIDVSVIGVHGDATLVELKCCGRFTATPRLLYVHLGGRQIFNVLGPSLPGDWEPGQRFSIFRTMECWTRLDLGRTEPHAHRIRSLELIGEAFTDEVLAELPHAVDLRVLRLRQTPISGSGLRELERLEKLSVLQLDLARPESFRLESLPELPSLHTLEVKSAPDRPWGFGLLAERLPRLCMLTLESQGRIHLDGDCPRVMTGGPVNSFTIYAAELAPTNAKLPERVDELRLHLTDTSEEELEQLLRSVVEVKRLFLSDSSIGDRLALELAERWPLEYFNATRTRVSLEALRELKKRYPRMRMRPNPRSAT